MGENENSEAEPLITLDLGEHNGGERPFFDSKSLVKWLEQEVEHFGWIGSQHTATRAVFKKLQQLRTFGQHYHEDPLRNDQVSARARTVYALERMPTSESPVGQLVTSVRATHGDNAGSAALSYFLSGHPMPPIHEDREAMLGTVLATLYHLELVGSLQSESASLAALRVRWEETLSAEHAATLASLDEADRLLADVDDRYGRYRRAGLRTIASMRAARRASIDRLDSALNDSLASAEKRLAEHEAFYRSEIALREAVEYWTSKAEDYGAAADRFLPAAFSMMVLAGLGAVGASAVVIDTNTPGWWEVVTVGSVIVFGFWMVRIFVRLALSNRHLATDAEERVVMAKTYLSLLEDERRPVGEQDRVLVLQALFRPSSTGLVRDDAAPPGGVELITRQLRG